MNGIVPKECALCQFAVCNLVTQRILGCLWHCSFLLLLPLVRNQWYHLQLRGPTKKDTMLPMIHLILVLWRSTKETHSNFNDFSSHASEIDLTILGCLCVDNSKAPPSRPKTVTYYSPRFLNARVVQSFRNYCCRSEDV